MVARNRPAVILSRNICNSIEFELDLYVVRGFSLSRRAAPTVRKTALSIRYDMPPQRVVRRAPLSDRIQSWLNPWDMMLWAMEHMNSWDWDELNTQYSNMAGIGLNLLFIFLRINSGGSASGDDIFEDYGQNSTGWWAWIVRNYSI